MIFPRIFEKSGERPQQTRKKSQKTTNKRGKSTPSTRRAQKRRSLGICPIQRVTHRPWKAMGVPGPAPGLASLQATGSGTWWGSPKTPRHQSWAPPSVTCFQGSSFSLGNERRERRRERKWSHLSRNGKCSLWQGVPNLCLSQQCKDSPAYLHKKWRKLVKWGNKIKIIIMATRSRVKPKIRCLLVAPLTMSRGGFPKTSMTRIKRSSSLSPGKRGCPV